MTTSLDEKRAMVGGVSTVLDPLPTWRSSDVDSILLALDAAIDLMEHTERSLSGLSFQGRNALLNLRHARDTLRTRRDDSELSQQVPGNDGGVS